MKALVILLVIAAILAANGMLAISMSFSKRSRKEKQHGYCHKGERRTNE